MSDKRQWRELVVDTSGEVWDKSEPIEGELIKIEHDIGPKKSNMYTLKTKDGEIKVWGSTVLDDKLLGVPEGSYIKIDYEGKVRGKSGNEYHSFKVFIDDASLHQVQQVTEDGESVPLDDMPPEFLK